MNSSISESFLSAPSTSNSIPLSSKLGSLISSSCIMLNIFPVSSIYTALELSKFKSSELILLEPIPYFSFRISDNSRIVLSLFFPVESFIPLVNDFLPMLS